MHVFSKPIIRDAAAAHPKHATAIFAWYKLMTKEIFTTFSELRTGFNSVDKVGNKFVFNVAGNNLRIIVAIRFDTRCVYILNVLTHKEYDKEKWK